jgi:hypothetical protein
MDKITWTNTLNTKSVAQSLKYPLKIRPPSPGTMLVNTLGHDYCITLLTFETATLYQGGGDATIL